MGFEVLSHTLRACSATWEGDARFLSANMLKGLYKLLAAFGEKISDSVFVEKLSIVSLKELTRTAKDQCAGLEGYAEGMLIYYNKKCRSPLPAQRLKDYKPHRSKHEEGKKIAEKDIDSLIKQRDEAAAIDEEMKAHNYYGVLSLDEKVTNVPVETSENALSYEQE